MSFFPSPAAAWWHCVGCQVDWKGADKACWACGMPGASGAFPRPAAYQPPASATCSTVEFDAPCPHCGTRCVWRSDRDEQPGDHLGARFTINCPCSTVSVWTEAPAAPRYVGELRAIARRTA